MNKPSKRRQNRRRSAEQSVDLSVKTDLGRKTDGSADVKARQDRSDPGHSAVGMDRDAQGYSSSSADNGEPQTPSPQSAEAYPVATQADVENDSEEITDPHFARLLNGLALSASKTSLEEKFAPRAASVTPTSAKTNGDKALVEEQGPDSATELIACSTNTPQIVTSGKPPPTAQQIVPSHTARPQSALPISNPAIDRQLKHLALLESVAQESAASFTPPNANVALRPFPSGAPPPFARSNGLPPSHPISHAPTLPPNHASITGTSSGHDPFIVRSRTSQALSPPSQVPQRRVPHLSQSSLLSILNEPRNNFPQAQRTFLASATSINFGHSLQPPMATPQPPSLAQAMPPQVYAQPLAGLQLGPAATPVPPFAQLAPPAHMGAPLQMVLPNPAAMHGPAGARSPNKAHLLSLLTSNDVGRHMTTLHADASRSTYPSGISVIQTPRVANNNGS